MGFSAVLTFPREGVWDAGGIRGGVRTGEGQLQRLADVAVALASAYGGCRVHFLSQQRVVRAHVSSLYYLSEFQMPLAAVQEAPGGPDILWRGGRARGDDLVIMDEDVPLPVLEAFGARVTCMLCQDPRPDATFQVHVKILTNHYLTFEAHASMTVGELQIMIKGREGIPPDQQNLRFRSRGLQPFRSMGECGIKLDDTITVCGLGLRGGMFHESSGRADFAELMGAYAINAVPMAHGSGDLLHVPVPASCTAEEADARVARALEGDGMRVLEVQLVPARPRVGRVLRLSVPSGEGWCSRAELEQLVASALSA